MSEKVYIMMEARLCALYSAEDEYEILEKYKGADLKNKGYKPLFDYFGHLKQEGAFRILCDTYVTQESGTGVVHQVSFFSWVYESYYYHWFTLKSNFFYK